MADWGHRHHQDHGGYDNDHRRHDNDHQRHDNDRRQYDNDQRRRDNDHQYDNSHERSRPPIITQQPQSFESVVVSQQPTAYQSREWSSGLCGCFKDIPSLLCVWFFGICYICKVSHDMGEGCCMAWRCPDVYVLAMLRLKLRTQHNIEGSICKDLSLSCCCWSCTLCQLKRELNYVEGK